MVVRNAVVERVNLGGGGGLPSGGDVGDTLFISSLTPRTLVWAPPGTSFSFAVASFTSNQSTTQEIGNTDPWKAAGAISFSATYTNGPATDGYVSHSGWSNLTMTGVDFQGPTASAEDVNFPSVGSSQAFTLHGSGAAGTATSTITINFYNRRYWGISTVASGYTEADVEVLGSNDLANARAKTFTVNATAGNYIIYSYPTRLGTATFTVGGFEGGFQDPETVSVTNASGYTENYYVYRSTNSGLGSTSVVVT